MGFFKDIKLDNLETDKLLTVDNNKVIRSTNINVSDVATLGDVQSVENLVTNLSADVVNLANRVTNLEGNMTDVQNRLMNINGSNNV